MQVRAMDEESYWGQGPDVPWARAVADACAAGGLGVSCYVIGDPADANSPVAAMIDYPPNWELPRHSHASGRVEVVVKGSVTIGDKVYGPGSVMTADKDEAYGPHQIGPEGCLTVEIMTGNGIRRMTFETPEGLATVDYDDPNFMSALGDDLTTRRPHDQTTGERRHAAGEAQRCPHTASGR
jgi:hypothetical protein